MGKQIRRLMAGIGVALTVGSGPVWASPYSADYVFGDSLSDRGNLADALGHHFPSPPFFHDSFSNGPTAVAVMAAQLGLSADPSLFPTLFQDSHNLGYAPGGTNYAVAASTAGSSLGQGVPGLNLANQIGAYLGLAGGTAASSALYTVFIGGNDVRTAAHQGNTAYVTDGVNAELAGIGALLAAGATNLLVVNVPDVGIIPEFVQGFPSQVQAAHNDSVAYNLALGSGIALLAAANPTASLKLFDFYNFNNQFIANAGSLGITDTTNPCYISYGGVTSPGPLVINPACGAIDPATGQAANIGQFLYWDAIHPTAKAEAALGNALYAFVTEVPEPASFVLLAAGLAATGAVRRRRGGPTDQAAPSKTP